MLKRIICLFVGHKHDPSKDIEEWMDGSITVQECCGRCGAVLTHFTRYGMSNETDIHYIRKRWVK